MKLIIIGGVAGGATAAARVRRLDEEAEIIVLERSGYVSYANCGLPYYLGGVIREEGELAVQTPEGLRRRYGLDIRIHSEAVSIDPVGKTVEIRETETGRTYRESYDKLLLSPGARPIVPALPGVDGERIFTLRTVEDTLRVRKFLEESGPRSAVIAGGGFIGLEVAENLAGRGMKVTIVQRPRQLLSPLDADMAAYVHAKVRERGITLRFGSTVEGFEETENGIRTLLRGEEPLETDMVLLAVGVTPETALAREAGLTLGVKGSIVTDEHMCSSDPDIYAVGDAVEVTQFVSGKRTLISLAGPANKQGRIAADNICGIPSRYEGSQGSSVIKVFDMTAAGTGINAKTAEELGLDFDYVILAPASHAGYYPGSRSMRMKVLFERKTGRLLGAQIVGYEGVDKRIDVLAAAIRLRATAFDLTELELAYAPPYSSAKDPVNMAGYVIENVLEGRVKQYHTAELEALPRDGSVILLDTRTPREYALGHAEGFINIPLDELRERHTELDAKKKVYVICQSGLRSYLACRILAQNGFDCCNYAGGYGHYRTVREDRAMPQESFPCGMEK